VVALTLTGGQFTAKQLNRQAVKAGKDEQTEKNKLKKVGVPRFVLVDGMLTG
jgi:hypothetical protein